MSDSLLGFIIGGGVCFLFFIIGAFILITGIKNRKKAQESTNWPSVAGTITNAWVDKQEHEDDDGFTTITYFPKWEYQFIVSGETYTGQNISFGGTSGSKRESEARAGLAQYPLNSQVKVFHNPTNPQEAVLITGDAGTMTAIVIGGILMVIMFVIILVLGIVALTN